MPEMPTIWPRLLIAVAEPLVSFPNDGRVSICPGAGPQITGRNCRTCVPTHVESWTPFSAQPTTRPRLSAPVAKLLLPPGSGRSALITPSSQMNPRHVNPPRRGPEKKGKQLQVSPFGSGVSVCEIPARIPRLFFTGHTTLLFLSGLPSVPRSSSELLRHNVACLF